MQFLISESLTNQREAPVVSYCTYTAFLFQKDEAYFIKGNKIIRFH